MKWSAPMFRNADDHRWPKETGEIDVKLRQIEVLMGQGMPRIAAIRQACVTEQTYYRWKK